MKLFEKIQHLVQKPPKVEPVIFLSLILDEAYVQAAAWTLDKENKPHIIQTTSERAAHPSWDDRIRMVDHAIGKLEEESGSTKLSKVVLGLGDRFLTKEGDIEKSVRPHLKLLTQSLALSPLGFVPLSTSIAHFLRKIEGIPTSVILIGVTERDFDISIYRVGRLAFSITVKKTESEGEDIENALKACTDAEVLPSRILLYGADEVRIEESKSLLLRHQWTAKANFLHYPKIELFPFVQLIDTVVAAGANEITQEIKEDEDQYQSFQDSSKSDMSDVSDHDDDKVATDAPLVEEPESISTGKEDKEKTHVVVVQPETMGFHESTDDREPNLSSSGDYEGLPEVVDENPLEFDDIKKENLLEKEMREEKEKNSMDDMLREEKSTPSKGARFAGFHTIFHVGKRMYHKTPKKMMFLMVFIFILAAVVVFGVTRVLPRASVTLTVLPKALTLQDTISIDPQRTDIDMEKKIIPANKLEKVVTGEKTVPATGKKKIGEAAKGSVTISNKTLSSYTLKKGTILTHGALRFSLVGDVSIASASENITKDVRTYGKATVGVVSETIGPEGNIPANADFTLKDYSSDTLSARNEQPFTGGTSKEVTVVSRADTDTLLKSLTADLIEKAKTELSQSVSGKERMIDQTVKTVVKEKLFIEEIDQEAKDLHGTLTVSVSAFTYNEEDVKSLLSRVLEKDIPSGYTVNPGRISVSIGEVIVAKDGKMSAKASLSAGAIPGINEEYIKKTIAGKKLSAVENELKTIPGVASAEFIFKWSFMKDVLPVNPDHISITVLTVE